MDTISPLRLMVPPQAALQPNEGLQDLASPKFIQLGDLEKLGASSTPQTLSPTESAASFSNLLGGLGPTETGGGSFSNLVGGFVNEVSQKQAAASDAVSGLLSGKNVGLHQAVISMEEASVSFQLMVEVRNKLLDSYQELMRMQV